MRYVFVSDIHGCYNKLIDSLNKVNFNREVDTIVSLGDAFDRGPDSLKVLKFLMGCPNRILVWGNHDLRLYKIFGAFEWNIYDFCNGVHNTLLSFSYQPTVESFKDINVYQCADMVANIKSDKEVWDLLRAYFNECCWAVEFDTLIGTHAWLPSSNLPDDDETWRKADARAWEAATWTDPTFEMPYNCPQKRLIIGHWHAFRIGLQYNERRVIGLTDIEDEDGHKLPIIDAGIFENKDVIAIDGCSNYEFGGQVNVYVYETDLGYTKI